MEIKPSQKVRSSAGTWRSNSKTEKTLIPKDNLDRVRMRLFIQNIPQKLISVFLSVRGYLKKSEEEQKQVRDNIDKALEALEENIKGPYVLG